MRTCTPDDHVYAGWILGTACQCGAMVVTYRPEGNLVRAEARDVPATTIHAPVLLADSVEAEVVADAAQAESEADQEAADALGPRRRRTR